MLQDSSGKLAAAAIVAAIIQSYPTAASAEAAAKLAAASADETAVAELVVTAQKRAENIQDVPISVIAATGSQLQAAGVNDVADLQLLGASFIESRAAQAANIRLNIRGVGASTSTGIEPSVATFLDDVYVPRPGALLGRFYDLDSVEVLRGPQGTLFGRNASVGALNVITHRPTHDREADLAMEGSSFNSFEMNGMVNMPLAAGAAVRLAAIGTTTDGFATTRVGNHHIGAEKTLGLRSTLLLEPTSDITWILRGDYMQIRGDGAADTAVKPDTVTPTAAANFAAHLGGVVPDLNNPFNRTENNFVTGFQHDHQFGLTSDLSYQVGGGYTLRLVDAVRNWRTDQVDGDILFTPLDMVTRLGFYDSKSQSHELQFISPKGAFGGRVSFVSGLYYFREDLNQGENLSYTTNVCNLVIKIAAPALLAPCLSGALQNVTVATFHQTTESEAAYAQADLLLTKTLTLQLGARYSHDDKSGLFLQTVNNPAGGLFRKAENSPLSFKAGQPTWRANLSWRPLDDVLVYATYSTGFESGGFNSGGGTVALGNLRIFNSETVDNTELGAKTTFADGRATLDATLFRMDVHNVQLPSFDGVNLRVRNAADLRQQGLEVISAFRPTRNLSFTANVTYLDSKFLDYANATGLPGFGGVQDLSGKPATFSPKWQGAIGAQYEHGVGSSGYKLALRGDLSFISDEFIGLVTDANPQTIQPGYSLVNTRLILHAPSDKWSVSLFGDNLFDKGYCTAFPAQTLDSVFGLRNSVTGGTVYRCLVGTPRSVGVRLDARF